MNEPTTGDDTLIGDASDNDIDGLSGADSLEGGAGNDVLIGGSGNDSLLGGSGRDVFCWDADAAGDRDRVEDLEIGDSLFFGGLTFTQLLDVSPGELGVGQATLQPPSEGVTTLVVRFAEGESGLVTIDLAGSLRAGDFAFVPSGHEAGVKIEYVLRPTEGDDSLVGGSNSDFMDGLGGNDTMDGGAGNDTLRGGAGADSLHGGAGQDTLAGGAGNDTIDGGEVTDRVNYTDLNVLQFTGATAAVNVNLLTGTAQDGQGGTDTISNIVHVTGTQFDDTITGGTAMSFEQFDGGAGNDTIDGGTLGTTSNRVWYQSAVGAVTVDLAAGTATGGGGNDTLFNINQVTGSVHGDTLRGSDTTATPATPAITETFIGRQGNDTIDGRGGIDVARYEGRAYANLATGIAYDGEGGTDTLLNIEGLRGSSFNDTLVGGNTASDAFEFFTGMGGDDTIDGGSGYDRSDYTSATQGVEVDLAEGVALDGLGGIDRLLNIEGVRGGNFNDGIHGSSAANRLEGGLGDDRLDGASGHDTLVGDAGDDTLVGGIGRDIFGWGAGSAGDHDEVQDLEVGDSLYFSGLAFTELMDVSPEELAIGQASLGTPWEGATTLYVRFGEGESGVLAVHLLGEHDASDFVFATYDGLGAKLVYSLTPTAEGEHLVGASNDDYVDALGGNDTVEGAGGNDTLIGAAGDDALSGDEGNDSLLGGDGNDSMHGGAGLDTLNGGAGNDTLDGGEVLDRINYTDQNVLQFTGALSGVTVNLATGEAQDGQGGLDLVSNIVTVVGTGFNDSLTGGTEMGFEQFDAGAGNDTIDGGTLGTATSNRASYASATVSVTIDLDAGTATGASIGTDTLININQVSGGSANDSLLGSDATEYTETFIGRAGNDFIDGRGGYDIARFEGAAVANLATGIAFDGQGGTDTLVNIEGLRGSGLADVLTGGNVASNDFEFFIGMGGNDTIDGGSGWDRADYTTGTTGVEVVLGESGWHGWAQDGLGGMDQLRNIEAVRGSNFDDEIDGNSFANRLEGRTGDDMIFGAGGDDTLVGDAGNDLLHGGDGNDVFGWGLGTAGDVDTVQDLELNDSLYFAGLLVTGFLEEPVELAVGEASLAQGMDGTTLVRVRFADGESGVTTIVLNGRYTAGNFSFVDDDGDGTQVSYDTLIIGEGDDHVIASSGNDLLDGLAGHDWIEGRGGRDTLVGGQGNDSLFGGAASDTLSGGLGDDSLDGGEVTDRVNYNDLNTLVYSDASGAVDVNLATGEAQDGDGGIDTITNFVAVVGSAYDDTLTGGTEMGFEMFEGGAGNDTIDGGELGTATSNRANYASSATAVTVNLANGSAIGTSIGEDTLVNINQVAGSSHADTLDGSNATLYTESFIGRGGNDTIDGFGGTDVARYDSAVTANLVTGVATTASEGTDTLRNIEGLRGSGAADTFIGGNVANNAFEFFTGMGGNDTIDGGVGYDRADYTTANFGANVNLSTGIAQDGMGGTDTLRNIEAVRGGIHGDVLFGNGGNNRLEGGSGTDYVEGGAGNDTVIGDDHNDTLVGGAGRDIFGFGASAAGDTERIQDLELGDSLYFNGLEFGTLLANADVDALEVGQATLAQPNEGKTMLYVRYAEGESGTAAIELLGTHRVANFGFAAFDGVGTRMFYQLVPTSGNDNLFGGSNDDLVEGLAGNDTLNGMDGNDTLDGGTGADVLRGGSGNDTYMIENAGDNIDGESSASSGGTDTVMTSVTYSAASDFIENITLTGSAGISATGNQLANVLTGNSGANVLNGGTGADVMRGGTGNDTYHVDHSGDNVDGESSASSGGVDTVIASVSYSAASDYIENITLAGSAGINATGNQLVNVLTGNSGANVLNGGAGADVMRGGSGNDTYHVDNAKDNIDGEASGSSGGIDTVVSTITWSVASDYVENVTLAGSASIDATGNQLANVLTGNTGDNVLNGGTGADVMRGGLGDDTYHVDNAGDNIDGEANSGSGGIDKVFSSVSLSIASDYIEQLELTGSAAINATGNLLANLLAGNSGKNTLDGAAGADTLDGGAGADILTGGSGGDRFVYGAAADSTLSALDRITDFTRGSDRIDLSQLDGNASKSGHQDFTFIGNKAFSSTATGQLRFALEGGKVMLYGSTDADTTAEFAISISGTTTLAASDFLF